MSGDAARKMSLSTWNKRKDLLLWVMQWATENQEERPHGAFDIIELVQLLQCAGFHLQKFELSANWKPNSHIALQLTCGRSGMTATMTTTPFLPCNCCLSKEMEAIVLNKMLDPIKQAMTVDVLKELIFIIGETDDNKNEKGSAHTWEVDPNTTPPRDSSSPMPSQNRDIIVKENIKQILTIATSTLDLLTESRVENTTFTKDPNKALKRVSEIKPVTTPLHCETPCATKKPLGKPGTPVPTSMYKNVSSRVDTFRQKSSPCLNAGKPIGAAKKPENNKISGTKLPRFGSAKRGELLSVKGTMKK